MAICHPDEVEYSSKTRYFSMEISCLFTTLSINMPVPAGIILVSEGKEFPGMKRSSCILVRARHPLPTVGRMDRTRRRMGWEIIISGSFREGLELVVFSLYTRIKIMFYKSINVIQRGGLEAIQIVDNELRPPSPERHASESWLRPSARMTSPCGLATGLPDESPFTRAIASSASWMRLGQASPRSPW